MDNKIQELTTKIYQEGVEKGNEEAQRIVEKAREQEQQIVAAAQKEAAAILAEAQKSAEEVTKNTQAELKLFASQALEALKSEVTNLLTAQLASSAVKGATQGDFMQEVILTVVKEWTKNEEVVISTQQAAELTKYFEAKAKAMLDGKVKIEQVNGIKTAFEIAPADGSYKITFGDEEFINYFTEFLRPQLVKMLF